MSQHPRWRQHRHATVVRTDLAITVDAGQIGLQGGHVIAQRLDPAWIGGAAKHRHRCGRGGGQMRGSSIVGDDEADFKQNLISVNSPIARGLIGKEQDDVVVIRTPGGEVEFEIIKVEYL